MKHHISAIALLSISSALFAEETAVPELPTTVVTADLWQSELQATTASVTLIDQAALESNGVQHFEDVINAIPNLTWTGGSSRPRYIQIRGIGENSQFEGETPDSSVRFLIDDIDLTGLGTVGNLFDVQQVEVLRGPQAGAFGANAAGGVVRIVTNDPTPYWTGQAEATVGNDDLRASGIAVGGPLLENDPEQLTFRLAVHKLLQNGFRDNVFLDQDDTNARDELTTRLKLRWLANEDWQFDGQLFYADVNNGFDEFTLTNDRTDTFTDEPGQDTQETLGASLRAQYSGLDKVEVSQVTTYIQTDSDYGFDGDWSNPTASLYFYDGTLAIDRQRDVFTQELRFDSKEKENAFGLIDRWTAGFYFQSLDEESQIDTGYSDSTGSFPDSFASNYESQTFSVFGKATHLISADTRVILGLRAEYFDLNTQIDRRGDVDFDDWLFGGQLTLEHDLNESQMLFGSVTRGYKAGGANIYPLLEEPLPTEYDTENLWSYEIGLRSSWLGGQLTSQVTLFIIDRQNAQLRDSAGDGIGFTYFTTNGEGAIHYGLEAEATYYFNEEWSLTTTLGLLETDRDSYEITVFDEEVDPGIDVNTDNDLFMQTIASRELANAPGYTYSARIDYRPSEGLFASAEIVGSDDYFESNSHNEKRDAFAVVNASIGYRVDNWTFTVWAKNVLDEKYAERVFFFNNTDFSDVDTRYEAPAAPRNFGVTANYSW